MSLQETPQPVPSAGACQLEPAGSFCWSAECADYGQVNRGNLIKFGHTRKGVQRYRCKSCGKVFASTHDTLFHGLQHRPETILECLALLAERGGFWQGTAICCDTRLRVARALAKSESEVAHALMQQLRDRLHHAHRNRPPALATDGKRAYEEALVQTWGQVPPYKGRGKRPSVKKGSPDWQYVRLIKHRQGRRLVQVEAQVVFGDPARVLEVMGAHTNRVERTFLSSRQMNGRLVRKTLSFSKRVCRLWEACVWEDIVYNLVRPCKGLRRRVGCGRCRWERRTPMMAAELTDHVWTLQ